MSLSISSYTGAAQKLGDNDAVRFKTDEPGIATTGWQKFKVAVADFFSLATTVAKRTKEAITDYKQAIQRDYGQDAADIASQHLKVALAGGKPLTARVVRDVEQLIAQQGGQHQAANDKLIAQYSSTQYGEPIEVQGKKLAFNPQGLTVNPVGPDIMIAAETVLEEARKNGLDPKTAERMQKSLMGEGGKIGDEFDDAIRTAIKDALREASEQRDEHLQIVGRTRLTPEDAGRIAVEAATKAMTEKVNGALLDQVLATQGLGERLAEGLKEKGIDSLMKYADVKLLAQSVLGMVQSKTAVQTADSIEKIVDSFVERYVDRQSEKLRNIEKLGFAEGKRLDLVLDTALRTGGAMGPKYFEGVAAFAKDLAGTLEQLSKAPGDGERREIGIAAAKHLKETLETLGLTEPDDRTRFFTMASALMLESAGKEGRVALEKMVSKEAFESFEGATEEIAMQGDEAARAMFELHNALREVSYVVEKTGG